MSLQLLVTYIMETNKDKIVNYSEEMLVIREILYTKIVQVWVTTNGHCFVKIAAIF